MSVHVYPNVRIRALARTHTQTRVHECLEWRTPRMVVSTRVITCLVHHKARTRPDVICRGPRKTRPTSQRFNTRPRTVGSLSKCRKSNCPGVHRFIIRTRGHRRAGACRALRASCVCLSIQGTPWIRAHGTSVCMCVYVSTNAWAYGV